MFGRSLRRSVIVPALLACVACGGVAGVLGRAETAYEQARYEDAELWLSEVEPEIHARDREVRARFHYLSGMTAYRLEQNVPARHHLGLAQELVGEDRDQILGMSWSRLLERTLLALRRDG